MIPGPWFRIPLLVLGALVVQEAVLRGLRVDGIRPDLMLGLAVVAGVVGGPERGAVVAFCAGILADLFLPTPFGLSALVWCLLAYTVGALHQTVVPYGRAGVPVVALLASGAGVVLFAVVGSVLGQPGMVTPHLLTITAVVAFINSLVSLPVARAVRWSLAGGGTERSFAA